VQQYGAQTKHRMGNQGPDDQRPEPSNVWSWEVTGTGLPLGSSL
jgi:hypothetical protein